MNLISCHIENFGKLSNYDHEFEKGCNVLCEKNGWGKSTLMAFLRVMLYGFANESKRSELENERKRYKPWQGGVYGGNLTFEAGGKTYRCYRVFGDKERDDQFRLLDVATNLETDDYSQRLGEELFRIDQDSFMKSACIGQMRSDIRFVETTGSMSAKLGGLLEETGDMSQFEAVDRKLTEMLNQMSPRRVTGSLYKQKKELEEYIFQISQKEKIEQAIADIRRKRQEETEKKEALKAERDRVNEKQKQLVNQEKRKRYLELRRERDLKREEYESRRDCLPKELPDETELDRKIKTAAEMEENRSAMGFYTLSTGEEQSLKNYEDKFNGNPPMQEDIERARAAVQTWRDNNRMLNELRVSDEDVRKLETYRSRFSAALPKEEELDRMIRNWEKRSQKKEALSTKRASLHMARMMARQAEEAAAGKAETEARKAEAEARKAEAEAAAKKSNNAVMGILLLAALLTGVAGVILFRKSMGGIGVVLGIVSAGMLMGAAAVYGRRRKKIKHASDGIGEPMRGRVEDFFFADAEGEEEFAATDAGYEDSDASGGEDGTVDGLEREIREDEGFIYETEEEIRRYLGSYDTPWEEYGVSDALHQLKNDVREYKTILAKEERYRQQERECDNDGVQRRIEEFLGRYDAPEAIAAGEYGELLQKLAGDMETYQKLKEKREHYLLRVRAYGRQKEELCSYLEQMSLKPEDGLQAQLLELQNDLRICAEKRQNLQSAEKALNAFEEGEESRAYLNESGEEILETAEQIYEKQTEISGLIERVQGNIQAYNMQLDENEEKIEEINEQELMLEELREIYDADLKKYDHLDKTQKYLKIARKRLTEKYMSPLMNGFKKYYGILTGAEAERYRLDASAHLTVEEQGLPRLPGLLSAGYRDIAGICMRMALIDAMYQDDAPFILMDDPFVNYDERNLRGGMELLNRISERYQIIYFTCRYADGKALK